MSKLLTQDQQELQDTLRSFFPDTFPSETLRKHIQNQQLDLWAPLAELGLAAFFSEMAGQPGGMTELGILAFESGRVLWPDNHIDSTFAGPYLLAKFKNSNPEGVQLPDSFANENFRISVAEPYAHTATLSFSAGKLSGKVAFLRDASKSSALLCFDSDTVYYVPESAACSLKQISSFDLTRDLYEVELQKVQASLLPGLNADEVRNKLKLLRAAEIAGVCARAVDMTVEYVKQRKQFDVPVGGFQAVQHRIAEMHLAAEAMRACAFFGLWAADHSPFQLALAAGAALIQAAKKAPWVIESAIQMHGGIGFTWEHDLHLYLRRVKQFELLSAGAKAEARDLYKYVGIVNS